MADGHHERYRASTPGLCAWRRAAILLVALTCGPVAAQESWHVVRLDDPASFQKLDENARPLGGGRFLVRLASSTTGLRAQPLDASLRLHPALKGGRIPAWTRADQNNVPLYVLWIDDRNAAGIINALGGQLLSPVSAIKASVVLIPADQLDNLADHEAVLWIEPPLPAFQSVNDGNRLITEVESVQTDYGLDGSGVSVMVYDGGGAEEGHPDFGGRLTDRDDALVLDHATHVSGTIGGSGLASGGNFRGMAPGVTLESYGFQVDFDGVTLPFLADPGDIEADYDEAINLYQTVIANNSIGINLCPNDFDCAIAGDYGVAAQLIDAIVTGALGQPMRIVWSAGNGRDCPRCIDEGVYHPQGYRSIAPPACAKNTIVVGAVQSHDEAMTSFSAWGPTDDGRIKPDLVAPGCQIGQDFGVTSTITGGGYIAFCGTSMAAPTVTGASALLIEDHRNRFPQKPDPSNAAIRALLLHTAGDLGPRGPDYRHGFGALRIRRAIDQMDDYLNDQLDHNERLIYPILVESGTDRIQVTCAWDDAPAAAGAPITLVNDLDLRLFDPNGTEYFPWTLDPADPAAPARQDRGDHRNNVEQVVVDQPAPGLWLASLHGYAVPLGPQPFALAVTPSLTGDCDGNGLADADEIASDPNLDCTGNGVLDRCEPDCNGNGQADSCEVGEDCDGDERPDSCAPDCDGDSVPDSCDLTIDCNANTVPDECEADCNGNTIADECDIGSGTSEDCNKDGIPDECQQTSDDCDGDGTWDACQTATDPSLDQNGNGIPDSCEPSDRTIHVAPCADSGDGSATDPFCTIQEGIDASISGNEVVVAPGTYSGAGNINLDFGGRLITLRSSDPSDESVVAQTVIDCRGAGRGLYFNSGETREATVDGLTIRGGIATLGSTPNDYRGGGIHCADSSPTIRRCVIEDCATGPTFFGRFGGGGIHCLRSSPLIDRCVLRRNTTFNHGAAIYCFDNSHAEIVGCRVLDNRSEFAGGGISASGLSNVTIRNTLVAGNHAPIRGGGISISNGIAAIRNCTITRNTTDFNAAALYLAFSNANVDNCTIAYNSAAESAGGMQISNGSVAVRNSILWGNAAPVAPQALGEVEATIVMLYNDVQGGLNEIVGAEHFIWDEDRNFSLDPMFIDVVADDFRLTSTSPCIDAGDPQFVIVPGETDLEGDGRVFGGRVDIGSDEFIDPDCNNNGVLDLEEIKNGASEDCDGNGIPDECEDCNENGAADICDIQSGISLDQNHNTIPDECEPTRTVYVDDNAPLDPSPEDPLLGDPAEDGSQEHPFDAIQEAIAITESGDTILVSPGLYKGLGNRALDYGGRTITVRCVDPAGECIVDAEGVDRGFVFQSGETKDARLEGFTIRNGWANEGGGMLFVNSSPTLVDCRLINNAVERLGGAIHCQNGAPAFFRCAFDGNSSTEFSGGGISADNASPSFRNCRITNNAADFSGGGVHATDLSELTFVNSLISGNSAVRGGGLYVSGGGVVVLSGTTVTGNVATDSFGAGVYLLSSLAVFDGSILWGNLSDVGGHEVFFNSVGQLFFTYSSVELSADAIEGSGSIIWDEGNIFDDPLFVDPLRGDSHLLPGSPCIDAGDPAIVVQRGEQDIDGEDRLAGRRVDIGADEFNVDCNANGQHDGDDIDQSISIDCNGNRVPDECEPDCDGNEVADPCDLFAGRYDDCNQNGVPDSCDLAAGTSEDLDANGVLDECEPCQTADDCSDGVFCNGAERCINGLCAPGFIACGGSHCDEASNSCVECLTDDHCANSNQCTIDTCLAGDCHSELTDGPCDDGNRCTDADVCDKGVCAGVAIEGCGSYFAMRAVAINENVLPGGPVDYLRVEPGDLMTVEFFAENWQPFQLNVYQVTLDASGYRSGPLGTLAPLTDPNPQAGAFIDESRSDFAFHGLSTITGVGTNSQDYTYGALSVFNSVPDDGSPRYCGTLKVVISEDAAGLFELTMVDSDDFSFMLEPATQPIEPLGLQSLSVFVDTDCNGNGVPDDLDISSGTSADCSLNGLPDDCEPDCNDNGVTDTCDVANGTSPDCDRNQIPDECDEDCNDNGRPDQCDIDDEISTDCNSNGVPDECDTAGGAGDCNGNQVPDDCETDCNENGVVDLCDIDEGISEDCDGNGVPDGMRARLQRK